MLRADLNKVHTWIYLFIEKAEEISASESRVTGCLKAAEGSLPKVLAPDFTARSLFLLPRSRPAQTTMQETLRCNSLACRRPLSQSAVVTTW